MDGLGCFWPALPRAHYGRRKILQRLARRFAALPCNVEPWRHPHGGGMGQSITTLLTSPDAAVEAKRPQPAMVAAPC